MSATINIHPSWVKGNSNEMLFDLRIYGEDNTINQRVLGFEHTIKDEDGVLLGKQGITFFLDELTEDEQRALFSSMATVVEKGLASLPEDKEES